MTNKLAKEILGVLKANPELSDSEKELVVEIRLDQFRNNIKEEGPVVLFSDYSSYLPSQNTVGLN